ncbi:MAG: hypothetical protein ACR2J8_14910, partial [Thermomicrobiales bacterium]
MNRATGAGLTAALLAIQLMGLAGPVWAAEARTAGACIVEPRTPLEVAMVAGTPEAEPHLAAAPTAHPVQEADAATPAPKRAREPKGPGVPLEIVLPEGGPASGEAVAGMTATMEQFAACYSAGEA